MKPPPLGLSLDDACVSCNISSSSTINEVRFLLQELSIYHEIILGLEIVNLLFFFSSRVNALLMARTVLRDLDILAAISGTRIQGERLSVVFSRQ